MHSNMTVIMIWAWMPLSSDALERERYCGLGMDAPVIGFGHGCCCHQMLPNMKVIVVWACMLLSSDAPKHECCSGWGMDALVIGCTRTSNVIVV